MKKILYILNLILVGILLYVILYPQIQKAKILKVRIAVYPSVSSFPVFVAEVKEIFKKHNIVPEIIYTSSTEIIDELKKGKVDIVVGYPVVDFFIQSREFIDNYRVVASCLMDTSFPYASVFSLSKKYSKIEQIKKTLFYYPSGRMEGKVLVKIFEKDYGFDLNNSFEYSELVPQKKEGFILVYEPLRTFFVYKNVREILKGVFLKYVSEPFVGGAVFVSKVTIIYKGRELGRFKKVWDEAVDFIRNNMTETTSLLFSFYTQKLGASYIQDLKDVNLKVPFYTKTGEISDIPYLSIVRVLRNTNFLITEPDISVLFEK